MANQSTARDVFMYLLVVVVLAMSATSLGMLLFDMVNIYMPDPIRPVCAYDGCAGAVNTEVAILLIAFPVLVWAWRFLQRDLKANPGKSDLWVRRWLLYLTLFVSSIASIIDLIFLVSNWLNGELTLQFFLKVLVVLGIAAATFYYFLQELRQNRRGKQRHVARLSVLVVVLALAAGIYTSAPWEARDRANDRDRVFALQNIQSEIVNFWQAKGRTPTTLPELNDPLRGFTVPTDPETGEAYEYSRKGSATFTLCATFTTASRGSSSSVDRPYPVGDLYGSNWDHEIGRTCFERTIDPQLYPPIKR